LEADYEAIDRNPRHGAAHAPARRRGKEGAEAGLEGHPRGRGETGCRVATRGGGEKERPGTSKRIVITDETLKKSTGHLSTTSIVYAPPPIPEKIEQPAEVIANEKRAKDRADEVKKAEEVKLEEAKKLKEAGRRARLAEAAEQSEEGLEDDIDPAQLEKDLAEEAKKNP
jgi:hypothetical protein